jgi:hypothetical protein
MTTLIVFRRASISMNELTWKYLAFVVAASILIWGMLELNKRLYRRNKIDQQSSWVNLDANKQEETEDEEPDEQDESAEGELRIRAQQNGHHSKTKT